MFTELAGALHAGLSLWASKEKTKYIDRLIKCEKEFYEEWNKPDGKRSHARLDELEFELRLLARGWAATVGASGNSAQS